MTRTTEREPGRGLAGVLLGLWAASAAACIGLEESAPEERATGAVSDSCGGDADGGVSGDGGAGDGGSASAAVAVVDAGTSRDGGAASDGGTRDGGSDGGTDGGSDPDAGTCSCPADKAWDGTAETVV